MTEKEQCAAHAERIRQHVSESQRWTVDDETFRMILDFVCRKAANGGHDEAYAMILLEEELLNTIYSERLMAASRIATEGLRAFMKKEAIQPCATFA